MVEIALAVPAAVLGSTVVFVPRDKVALRAFASLARSDAVLKRLDTQGLFVELSRWKLPARPIALVAVCDPAVASNLGADRNLIRCTGAELEGAGCERPENHS